MVSDSNNRVYTELLDYLKTIGKIDGGQIYDAKKAKFPFMHFLQIDTATSKQTLSQTEDVIRVLYQVDVYSTKSMDEARKISYRIRVWMIEHGFICIGQRPWTLESPFRFISRFQRLEVEEAEEE